MGSFLLLFLFAALNVALGWVTANWFARRQSALFGAIEETPSTVEEAVQDTADKPVAESQPAATQTAETATEETATNPASTASEPKSEAPAPDKTAPAEVEKQTAPEDTSHLAYDEYIDRVAQDCLFTNATSQVLKLKVEELRSTVLSAESIYRVAQETGEEELVSTLEEIKTALTQWLPEQQSASDHLANAGVQDSFTERAKVIDGLLSGATTRMQSSGQRILNSQDDNVAEDANRIRRELGGLMDACHNLRDAIQEGFATVVQENRQFTCNSALHSDENTGLVNIVGLDAAIVEWWESKEQAGDAATLVVLDVDGMAQLNQQIGTDACDHLLLKISAILSNAFRQDRGFDVAARISGQRFAGLLGYTTARQGANALERVRQIIAGLQITAPEGEFNVRVSTAATALQKNVPLEKHMGWLTQSLEFAKERGGNCTVIWRDDEPTCVDPIEYDTPTCVVNLVPDRTENKSEMSAEASTPTEPIVDSIEVAEEETQSIDATTSSDRLESPETEPISPESAASEPHPEEQAGEQTVVEDATVAVAMDEAIAESEELEASIQSDVEQLLADAGALADPGIDAADETDEKVTEAEVAPTAEESAEMEAAEVEASDEPTPAPGNTIVEDGDVSASIEAAIAESEELEASIQSDVEQLLADAGAMATGDDEPVEDSDSSPHDGATDSLENLTVEEEFPTHATSEESPAQASAPPEESAPDVEPSQGDSATDSEVPA